MQQQHFEQVAHGLGVADDVVADALFAKALQHDLCHGKDGQFAFGVGAVLHAMHPQGACIVEQPQQQGAFSGLVQAAVIRCNAGRRQQLGHYCFVFVGALAQVYCGQVKAKHIHRANQRAQALVHQRRAMVGFERDFNGAQVGDEVLAA